MTQRATRTLANAKKKFSFTYSGLTASALLTDAAGNSRFDCSDVDWTRCTVMLTLDSITGTSVLARVLTSGKGGNTGATTDYVALKADGSTSFATASVASATKVATSTGKWASTGATASTMMDSFSIYLVGDTLSGGGASGSVDVLFD
jgi:hypothetical protein